MHIFDVLMFTAGSHPILDNERIRADILLTEKIRASERRGRLVRICPAESPSCRWSVHSLFISLHELPIDWTNYHTVGRDRAVGDAILQLLDAGGNGQGANRIRIDIGDDWILSVQIFRSGINWDVWQIMEQYEETMQGTQKPARHKNDLVADDSIKPKKWKRMDQIIRFCASTSERLPSDSAEFGFKAIPRGASREEPAVSIHIFTASAFPDPEARPHCDVRARIAGVHPGVFEFGYWTVAAG
jgi:hypothetical protein